MPVGEHGGTEGVVTLTDVLEAIVGDVPMTGQSDAVLSAPLADGMWVLSGMTSMDEVEEVLGVDRLSPEGRGAVSTLGGFVMLHLGRVPEPGDQFRWEGLTFEVVAMDKLRVDRVQIRTVADVPAGQTA